MKLGSIKSVNDANLCPKNGEQIWGVMFALRSSLQSISFSQEFENLLVSLLFFCSRKVNGQPCLQVVKPSIEEEH